MGGAEQNLIRVLDSKPVLDILNLLVEGPKDVGEIERRLSFNRSSIRYHLLDLEYSGYVERCEAKSEIGRPRHLYALRKDLPLLTFPKRRYKELAEFLMTRYTEAMGVEELKRALREFGYLVGKGSFSPAVFHNSGTCDLSDFRRVINYECTSSMGLYRIVEDSTHRLSYRVYDCPFRELSTKHGGFFCDAVLQGYQDNVKEASKGRITLCQTKRMLGGGYCEYEASDQSESDPKSQGTEI